MMLSQLEDRLKDAMAEKFHTVKELSVATGIPYPSLREYLSGKKRPGFDALASFVKATEISADWLLTGEGEKERKPGYNQSPESAAVIRAAIEELQAWQVREQRFLPAQKFVEAVFTLCELAEDKPERVKPAAAMVLRLVA
ncbi:MAG: helix-turn-helix transcriptional regulator [Rhodocyclaceae bacterium]|nr:helix-turn-helix transcriptional regulator [Rhodocyclaceae bacterium]